MSLAPVAVFGLVAVLALRQELVQDSWMTLVAGREIVQHGLPHHDALFAWTSGRRWIDQQWLAQLAIYGLYTVGGIRAVMAAHVLTLTGAVAILVWLARRRGASPAAVCATGVVSSLIAPWALQIRAQTFGQLLFAVCLALLLVPGRFGAARLVGLLAVLVVWANLHGSVLVGAGLAAVKGLTMLADRQERRLRMGASLIVLPLSAVFASPYNVHLVGYYHSLIANPLISRFIDEWRVSKPSQATALFYVVLAASIALAVRHWRRLPIFDALALALLAAAAIQSVRSIVWFSLAATPLVAPLTDELLPRRVGPAMRAIGYAGIVMALSLPVLAVTMLARSPSQLTSAWPTAAAERTASTLTAHPHATLLADSRYSDWLLWEEPTLRGRIAFDVRFELFDQRQFQALAERGTQGHDWRNAVRKSAYVVFDPRSERCGIEPCDLVFRTSSYALARSPH